MKAIIKNFLKGGLLAILLSGYTTDVQSNAATNFFKYMWGLPNSIFDPNFLPTAGLVVLVGGLVHGTRYWYSSAEDKLAMVKYILQLIKDHPEMSATAVIVAVVFSIFHEPKKETLPKKQKESVTLTIST